MHEPRNPGEQGTDRDDPGRFETTAEIDPFGLGIEAEQAVETDTERDGRQASGTATRRAPLPPDAWTTATIQRLVWADRFALDLREAADRLTVPLAHAARTFVEQRTWTVFLCARAEDHCRERFDRTARWLRGLAVLGRGLDVLPGLERAVTGEADAPPLGRSLAIEVAKVASPDSVTAWIGLARTLSVRALAKAVRLARQAKSAWPTEIDDGARPANTAGASGDSSPRCEVRLPVPGPLRVAFDEVLHLHRAVSGHDVSVADFVEALVAEAMTGSAPVDVDRVPLEKSRPVAAIERELEQANDEWRWLDRIEVPDPASIRKRDRAFDGLQEETVKLLHELETASIAPHTGTPADLNRRIQQLVGLEDRIERQLGRLLKYMGDKHAWLRLEFDGVEHYAAERLCMQRRTARDRARAATVTRRLPLLRDAYESGSLGLQSTLLVARALGPWIVPRAMERAWVEHARRVSVKRLREEVRVAERDWLEHGSWGPREPLSDEEWWRSLAHHPGTTRRRFARLVGVAGSAALRDTVTHLTFRLTEPRADDFLAAIESRSLQLSQAWITSSVDRPDEDCPTPLAMRTAVAFLARGLALPSWVGLMALLEEYVGTWDPAKVPRRTRHGLIHGRDGYRCAAPLCTSRRNLEGHHVVPQSRGGGDEPDNLVSICRFHHQRGAHGELGVCSGKAPLGLLWRLGREDVGEWFQNERRRPAPPDQVASA